MRLIDADALLEQLSKKDSEVHIGLVMQLIDSMPTVQREGWVSVDDRLPDIENKNLLCTDANNLKGYLATYDIFVAVFYKGKWYLVADSDYPHEIKVTYWQYLPAAPTETE